MREAALKSTIFVGVPRVCGGAPPIFQPSLNILFFSLAGHWRSRWFDRCAREGCQGWLTDPFAQVWRVFAPLFRRFDGFADGDVNATPLLHLLSRNATPENIDAIVANGMALWNSIYEPHAVKLYEKLGSYHPDLICTSPPPSSPPPWLAAAAPGVECAQRPTHAPLLRALRFFLGGVAPHERFPFLSSVHYPVVRLCALATFGRSGRTG
jgi:hypothetical protein